MLAQPQLQHEWLSRLVGRWTSEAKCSAGSDQPPETFRGTEVVRSLGGLWILCEGEGDMPGGGKALSVITLGFDPAQSRFVGTFIASVMTHLWVYNGSLDATGKVLTLDAEGPDWSNDNKLAKYHDIITIVDDDHRMLTSEKLNDDGTWTQFMESHYHRVM